MAGLLLVEPLPVTAVGSGEMKTVLDLCFAIGSATKCGGTCSGLVWLVLGPQSTVFCS